MTFAGTSTQCSVILLVNAKKNVTCCKRKNEREHKHEREHECKREHECERKHERKHTMSLLASVITCINVFCSQEVAKQTKKVLCNLLLSDTTWRSKTCSHSKEDSHHKPIHVHSV